MSYQQGYQQPPPPGWNPQGQGYGYSNMPPGMQGQQQGQPGGMPMPMPPPMHHYPPDMGESGEPPKQGNVAFSDKSIRQGFIRKVFFLLTLQLLVVMAITAPIYAVESARNFVSKTTGGLVLYLVAYVFWFGTYLTLVCCESVRRKHPVNLIILAIFTVATGYMTAMITARHNVEPVVLALGITIVACGGITLFACQTKYDFTSCMGVMLVITLVLAGFGFLIMILSIFSVNIKIMYLIYSGAGALIFMMWLAIDVQMVIGGKKYEIGPEDYVFATLQLFMDIVYIFWFLLELIGGASNN